MLPKQPLPWLLPHVRSDERANPRREVSFQVVASTAAPLEIVLPALARRHELTMNDVPVSDFGGSQLRSILVVFSQLPPDTLVDAQLRDMASGAILDRVTVRTWPDSIGGSDLPFRLFLGSCFSTSSVVDGGNNLSGLTNVLGKTAAVPHLKVLCGDQVYLDIPVTENLPTESEAMDRFVLGKYLTNWGATGEGSSCFGSLLRTGSNAFVCDDHEFWNNYPNTAIYAPRLYRVGGGVQRSIQFAASAKRALRFFQRIPPSFRALELGDEAAPLTLLLLDGRVERGKDLAHSPADLALAAERLRSAKGPVLLVLSQPLFDSAHRGWVRRLWAERVADLSLADFDDYRTLVEAIARCPHDVCILTGDIHGGRICGAFARDQTVWEIVSSPLSLVRPAKSFGGSAPKVRYPDLEGRRSFYGTFTTDLQSVGRNHGVSLAIYRRGSGYAIDARYIQSDKGLELQKRLIPLNRGAQP